MIEKYETAEECVSHGGHCWKGDGTSIVMGFDERYTTEWCKHCPAVRHGRAREPWEWTVHPEGRPGPAGRAEGGA